VSHAGVSSSTNNPFDADCPKGVLWNRQPLKNLGKIQIFGHTPTPNNQPSQDIQSNSWNIDTGACFGGNLSAVRLSFHGELMSTHSIKTLEIDTCRFG
jgi:serine/threonine protein phosphatase 1